MSTPRFFQAVLQEVTGDVFAHLHPEKYGPGGKHEKYKPTIEERLGTKEGTCSDCGDNRWIIQAKESAAVQEGGKDYIECLSCGHLTHL